MIIVDCSGLFFMSVHTTLKNPADLTLENVRHYMLHQLSQVNKKHRKKYGRMVLTWDNTHGGNWRRDYFDLYKANRKASREASVFDWNKFFGFYGQVKQELKEHFPYKSFDIPMLEADDVIGWLCENQHLSLEPMELILIMSADKDFKQLQRYGNVEQYSYITKKFLVEKEPLKYLKEHTIRGDSSDGVPNVYSDDDVFINPLKKQKSVMTKDITRWMELNEGLVKKELAMNLLKPIKKKELSEAKCSDALTRIEENWKRNQMMVDLSLLPQQYKDLIEAENEIPVTAKSNKLYSYFIKKKLDVMINFIEDFL